tara:strand:- start:10936 stop:11676 length:741 start_codon:yes stop_codon:yes gene_type:complete
MIKKVFIKDKLEEIGFSLDRISLGDFDQIGEMTAKKARDPSKDLYKSVGCFFRPNYERGILLHSLIATFNISSILEIGTGRGYSAICMAKAMADLGIDGNITTVDPNLDEELFQNLARVIPQPWWNKIDFVKGKSQDFLGDTSDNYELIYIDGDHRYDAVLQDWNLSKDRYTKFLLFDDYHLPSKKQLDIDCATVIDEIQDDSKELIIMDRRIFFDDRRLADDEIDYGQVLLTHPSIKLEDYIMDW